jgi:O-antigen ligase
MAHLVAISSRYSLLRILIIAAGTALLTSVATRLNLVLAIYVIAGGGTAFWLTWRFPLIAIVALFLTGSVPDILVFTPAMIEAGNAIAISGGINAVDVVLVVMLVAVVARILGEISGRTHTLPRILLFLYALMAFWFAIAVIRNTDTYGLSAFGEFRYRYLVLIIVAYVGYFFPTGKSRLQAFKVIVIGSVLLPLALLPVIGQQLNWAFGSIYRFLPPNVSLGIVYGLIALILAKKYNYLATWSWVIWLLIIIVGFTLLIDSPRSTWLAMIVAFMLLTVAREIGLQRILRFSVVGAAALAVVLWLVSSVGIDPMDTLANRAVAIYAPTEDANASWRIELWTAYVQRSLDASSLVMGEGFGGHWSIEVGFGREITVFPHNLFVMTLVKLGIVGVGIYLAIILVMANLFWGFLKRQDLRRHPEYPLVLTALVALVASQAFYMAFGLDYYTWLFVGLGIAVLREQETYAAPQHIYCDSSSQSHPFHA